MRQKFEKWISQIAEGSMENLQPRGSTSTDGLCTFWIDQKWLLTEGTVSESLKPDMDS